jgi:1-acyl-sn-glycerol-3-phosphate acyltransferase
MRIGDSDVARTAAAQRAHPISSGSSTTLAVLRLWARTALRVFYGRTEVTADRPVPQDRPTILAANHTNALADVAVLVANAPRFPRFLAASSWWDRAAARVLFRLGGVLPVERAHERSGSAPNTSTFEACRAALARGEHIAIFPEGELNVGTGLLPIRTGAARIGVDAAIDGGVPGVSIVPVALAYEDPGRFRSGLHIHFGEPIELADWADECRVDPVRAVRTITELLGTRLADAADHGDGPDASVVTRRAASMVLSDSVDAWSGRGSLARRRDLSRRLRTSGAGAVDDGALAGVVEAHSRNLERLGFDDTHPLDEDPATTARLIELGLLAPVAAAGAVANAPVVVGASLLNRVVGRDGWTATIEGVSGTFLFVATVVGEFLFVARRSGVRRAVVMTAAASAGGVAALGWWDRLRAARRSVAVRRAERTRAAELDAARRSRAELTRLVESIVAGSDQFPVDLGHDRG